MIIDCILDRYDAEKNYNDFDYCARDFYYAIFEYGKIGHGITRAMDGGEENDTRRELCEYIDKGGYNPKIKDFINARKWNENQREKMPIIEIL